MNRGIIIGSLMSWLPPSSKLSASSQTASKLDGAGNEPPKHLRWIRSGSSSTKEALQTWPLHHGLYWNISVLFKPSDLETEITSDVNFCA